MLGPLEMIAIFFVFGCPTWLVSKLIDRAFAGRQKQGQMDAREAKEALDRARSLETQLMDAHRQNDQLQKQLEWNTKMLETQDRLVKQIGNGQVKPAVSAA